MGEVPLLQKIGAKHAGDGLTLVGVSVDDSAEALDRMVAAKGMAWTQVWEPGGYAAPIPKLFAVEGTPVLYLVDRAGRLAGRFGAAAELEAALPEVLASPASVRRTPRDEWQRPNAVMDRLGLRAGSHVADVGAGDGYFTRHLAPRVGTGGRVLAADIDQAAVAELREAAAAEGLTQVEAVLGVPDDPRLPAGGLDAALAVDAYHEFTVPDAMLRRIAGALRPGGRLGIIEESDDLGRSRSEYRDRHRLPAEIVIEEAARAGLRLTWFEARFTTRAGAAAQYLALFEKAE